MGDQKRTEKELLTMETCSQTVEVDIENTVKCNLSQIYYIK